MRLIFTIILIVLCFQTLEAQYDSIDWGMDLKYIQEELPKIHYDLFFKQSQADFEKGITKLVSEAPNLTDYQILIKLSQTMAKVGDSHTNIDFGRYYRADKRLPFRLYWFSDGLYITQARLDYEELLGQKLLAINGYPLKQIVDSLSSLIAIDNESTITSVIPRIIDFVPFLECFGFSADNNHILTTKDLNGVTSNIIIDGTKQENEEFARFEPDAMSFCWSHQNMFFIDTLFEQDSILYIQYNRCWSKELEKLFGSRDRAKTFPSFRKFQKKILKQVKNNAIKKVLFDLRFNSGGSSLQGTQLIKMIARNQRINEKGKLYVVTGKHTFSSGIINIMDFKEYTNAIFVGEVTSGRPNHYGEIKQLLLKSSGLSLNYSTKYFSKYKPDKDAFYPDIEIETCFYDYKNGIDPIFEHIRKL